jgi:hypothetical protein
MRQVEESDQDIVYNGTAAARTRRSADAVTIGVHELTLNEKCSIFEDDRCEKVFVSVEFLNYPADQLETPYALPKGEPNTKYSFNFQTGESIGIGRQEIISPLFD